MSLPKVAGTTPEYVELDEGTYYWCACGLSAKQPFCDSAHKGSGISPKPFVIKEKKRVALCMCKQTKKPPYCDGTHNLL